MYRSWNKKSLSSACIAVSARVVRVHDMHSINETRCVQCRTLNGFLNTGKGGTVYLGVLDSGTVKGLVMSHHQVKYYEVNPLFQINHVKLSLADLMNRYTPPVSKRQYTVSYG